MDVESILHYFQPGEMYAESSLHSNPLGEMVLKSPSLDGSGKGEGDNYLK
jgi:hypothetical protein